MAPSARPAWKGPTVKCNAAIGLALAGGLLAAPAMAWEKPSCALDATSAPYCYVSTSLYHSGTERKQEVGIYIQGVGGDAAVTVQIHDEAWRMDKRTGLTASVRTEVGEPVTRPASTVGNSVFIELLPDDLEHLAARRRLFVTLPNFRANYSLAGSRSAIRELAHAYRNFVDASDPFAGAEAPPPSEAVPPQPAVSSPDQGRFV